VERSRGTSRAWTAVVFAAVAVGGAALQARGALVPSFATAFGLSESQLGLITPVATLGFVGPVVAVGVLAGRVDVRRTFAAGVFLAGVTIALAGLAPTYAVLLALVALQSATNGVIRGLDRPILGHLHPDSRGRVFTRETMVWAVGATLGPFLVTAAIAAGSWRFTFFALGGLFVVVALAVRRLEFPVSGLDERPLAVADVRPLLREPAVLGMVAVMVLVGGIESTFFTWLPYYASDFLPRSAANLALSVYLAAYVPGRLGFSLLADRASPPDLVLVAGAVLLGVLVLLFGAGPTGRLPFYLLTFGAGLFVSGVFPLTLTWGVEASPTYTGPINAVAMVSVQVGFFVVPATVGVLAEATTIGTAMLVQVALAGGLVAFLGGRRLAGAVLG
jgi:MFS family permease